MRKFIYAGFINTSVFIALLLFYSPATAQNVFDYASPKEYEIADIQITGIKFLNINTLIQISGLTVGETITIPGDEIAQAMEKLWAQNLFSDIEISATRIEDDKIWLEIDLLERPRLSRFEFRGIRRTDAKELEDKIGLVPGAQITDNTLINARHTILKYFVGKGFYRTKLDILQVEDTMYLNTNILVFDIQKNERIRINDITVEGNEIFSDAKIRRFIKDTKKKRWYGMFKPSKYVPDKYSDDLKNVVTKYNKKGYRDARIIADTIYDFDQNLLQIHLQIFEGPQYFFRNITWVGNTKYTSEHLEKTLGIKPGDIFNQELLDKRLTYADDAVGNLYMDNGYLFYHVVPTEILVENDSIDLEMRIYEGKQATVNQVLITGNTKTNEHVVRREIRTQPGQLFSKSDITRTIRELAQLGHFDPEKLNVNPVPNLANGTVDLEYLVEERASDQIEVSGGWGAGMIVGTLGLSFNNFAASKLFDGKSWNPIPSGDGQRLSVRAQSNGRWYQNYSISFSEPWLGGKKPTSFSLGAYKSIQSNGRKLSDSLRTAIDISGASLGLGRRLSWPDDYFTLVNDLSFQHYYLNNWSMFSLTNGRANNLSFGSTFSRSSTDNPMFTRSGSLFSLQVQMTLPYSWMDGHNDYAGITDTERYKWIEYHKWKFNAEWYTRIVGDLVLRTRAQYGFLGYYTKEKRSPFEDFTLGGSGFTGYSFYGRETIALKGYEDNSLTPPGGANLFNRYTVELRYLISPNPQAIIYAKAFAEAGNAWTDFHDFNPFHNYRSAGLGLRFFLPMVGLMGVDWGYGFDKVPGNASANGSNWHFVLGQEF